MLFVIGWKLVEAVALAVTPGVVSRMRVVVVRGRGLSLRVFDQRGNSGAFRLVRGAIAGQKSQRVRDHKKVRRKEKRETSVQESRQENLLARTERQASKPNRSWAVPSSPLTTPCLRASFPKIVF
jgi:hypothetical protein